MRIAGSISGTLFNHRATCAIGVSGDAMQCSEFHQCLIMLAGMSGRHHKRCQPTVFTNPFSTVCGCLYRKEPSQYPDHIPVDGRIRQIPCERSNGCRRIFSNTFEREDRLVRRRENSVVSLPDILCGLVQIACAGVIPQPLPVFQYLFLRSIGKASDIGKSLDKTVIVIQPLGYTCLLENNFRNPYTIRIGSVSPR